MAANPKPLLKCAKEALVVHLACGFQRNKHTGRYPSPDALIKHLDYTTKEIYAILRLLLDQDDAERICSKACHHGCLGEALTYWIKLWHAQLLMGPWDCSSKFQTAQRDRDAHPSLSKVLLSPDVVVTPFTEPRSGCYKLKQDPLSVRWGGSIIWHDRITQELAVLIQNSMHHNCHFLDPGMRMAIELFRSFYTRNCCYVGGLDGDSGAQYGCCGGLRFRPAAWAEQAIWHNSQTLCLTPYSSKNHHVLAQLGQHAPMSGNDAAEVMLAAPRLSRRNRSNFCPELLLCDYGGVGGACELCLMDAWTTNGTLRDVRLLYRAFDPVNKFHTLDDDGQHVPYVKLLCVPEVEVMLKGYHVSNNKIPPPRDTRFGPLATTICFDSDRCIFFTSGTL